MKEFFQAWLTYETVDRYWQAKQNVVLSVVEEKAWVWEEFGDAMENYFWSASKRFWQSVRCLRRGRQGSGHAVDFTQDIVKQ